MVCQYKKVCKSFNCKAKIFTQMSGVFYEYIKIGRLSISVVIIGGHDRMVCQYKKVCKSFNCKAKIFTQMSATLSKQIGNPDLIVLFTNTVSIRWPGVQ